MKKIILAVVLVVSIAGANRVTCIDFGGGMKQCTDENGNTTTIWTY